ncbi:MAG: hypothetical protein ACKO6K_10145 [Chitinophagaceae bacterium]
MKKLMTLSKWAHTHLWTARLVIVVAHLLLIILALFIGWQLQLLNINIPSVVLFSSIAIYLMAFAAYPRQSERGTRWDKTTFYIRQKACDAIILSTTVLMIVQLSNEYTRTGRFNLLQGWQTTAYASFPVVGKIERNKTVLPLVHPKNTSATNSKLSWREQRKQIRENWRKVKAYLKKTDSSDRAGLTFLSILGVFALLSLLALLVCSLGCNGQEGAAIAVGVLGTAGVIALFILLMKRIYKKDPDPPAQPQNS